MPRPEWHSSGGDVVGVEIMVSHAWAGTVRVKRRRSVSELFDEIKVSIFKLFIHKLSSSRCSSQFLVRR